MRNIPQIFILFVLLPVTVGAQPQGSADRVAYLNPADKHASSAAYNWKDLDEHKLHLRSEHALIVDEIGREVYGKEVDSAVPIASITKLMTAMVVLDAKVDLSRKIAITKEDRDLLRHTGSRLRDGQASLSRHDLLQIALMSSENRAAAALSRTTFPGGAPEFIRAMNRKAKALGMTDTAFVDGTGLDAGNVASPRDLVKLLRAAYGYPLIRQATTTPSAEVRPYSKRASLKYVNTNRLLKNDSWEIGLSKTGYIDEAGRCLVMRAIISDRPLYIVLLNSYGKLTPFGDSNRLRKWIEQEARSG